MTEITSDFQFIDHRINSLKVKNSFSDIPNEHILQLSLGYKETPAEKATEDGNYLGRLRLMVRCSGQDPAKEGAEISIQLVVEGLFCASEDTMDIDVFNEMLVINGLATLYSIVRSIIISVSAQCCTNGQIRVPMLNMVEVHRACEESQRESATEADERWENQF